MHEHEAVAIWDYTGNAYRSMNEPFWTERDAATRAQGAAGAGADYRSGDVRACRSSKPGKPGDVLPWRA